MEIYLIVFLCIVLIIMSAITANALNKIKEIEDMYGSLNNRYERELEGSRVKNREKQDLWLTVDELEKENQKLKELIEKYNVTRETGYNKSYGIPEVVDYYNARYPGEEPK